MNDQHDPTRDNQVYEGLVSENAKLREELYRVKSDLEYWRNDSAVKARTIAELERSRDEVSDYQDELEAKVKRYEKQLQAVTATANVRLRDDFAGKALAGLTQNGQYASGQIATAAYQFADAMLIAREKKP